MSDETAFQSDGPVVTVILVAGILVVPIHDPERAIGPGLSADRAKPAIVGDQKIFITGAYEARRGRSELIVIDGALMDIADKNGAKPLGGILASLINIDARECRAEMFMVDD